MSGPSKVVVLDPDPRAGRQLRLGFEREGVTAVVPPVPVDTGKLELGGEPDPAVVVVGGTDGRAIELVRRTRALLEAAHSDVPIVWTGRGGARDELEAAGADEIVMQPAYLRDVITIGRIVSGVPARQRDRLVGSLAETTGVYTLVRALAALGRSAVLTLLRGLRRGEIRFWQGEVTSAQVGLIHGQAALHQLLLWTDARFEFAREDIVRRQQIPLAPAELFADAERFLEGVRESAGGLSPAMVLEQDVQRVHALGKQIPTEVHGVLRMFDGHRVLADVLEDSPYRVFETLRVAQKAMEAGLLRPTAAPRAKATWRAVLAIEEWLVGNETREQVVERTARLDSEPGVTAKFKKRKRRKKRRAQTPPAGLPAPRADIDWGALVPRVIGAEVGPLSGVVPAMDAAGEIEVATRAAEREGLEALMDTAKRQRIFPTDIGLEPSVVVPPSDTDEWEKVEWEAKAKTEAEAKARAEAEAAEAAQAKARANAAQAERDRVARDEAVRAERERLDRERAEQAAAEQAEREQRERARAQQAAQEQAAREQAVRDQAAKEQAERDLAAREQAVRDQAAREQAERDLAAREQAVRDLAAREQAVRDERERLERAREADTVKTPKLEPAAPTAADDEPSDGVVRAIAAVDTAKLLRARRAPSEPESDGPPIKETTGEIDPTRLKKPTEPPPISGEPSILVSDLAAVHTAVAAALARPLPEPPPSDAASSSKELAVSEVRRDAVAFSEAEEAFFRRADHGHAPHHPPAHHVESFADLDEGYEPPKFWDRVFGRRRKRPSSTQLPIVKPRDKK
ncbi:MAG TPA: DUF4388 domain-containing protein [Kofleriaceae bacterium]|nr:DUF4388 domain-containing protein [Kofleriaceae bacterium]